MAVQPPAVSEASAAPRARRRRGRLLVLLEFAVLAGIANVLAMQLPGSTPFLVGNMAAVAITLRFGPAYGLPVAVVSTGVTAEWLWVALACLEVASVSRFRNSPLGFGGLAWRVWWPLLPVVAWITLPPGAADPLRWALSTAVVLATGATSLAGALLLRRITRSRAAMARQPLGVQLSVQLATLTAAPATFVLMLVMQASAQQDLQRLGLLLDARASELLTATADHLAQHRLAVAHAATGLTSADDAVSAMARLSSSYPGFLSVLVADAEGRVVATQRRGEAAIARGGSVADRDYFQAAMATPGATVSPVFRGRGIGSDVIVATAARFGPEGIPAGILQGALGLGLVALPLRNRLDAEGLHQVIVDGEGAVVLSTLPGLESLARLDADGPLGEGAVAAPWWARPLFPAPAVRFDGAQRHLVARATDDRSGWSTLILQPTAPIEARQTLRSLLGALGVLGMILGMQWFATRFAQRHTRGLSAIVQRLQDPDAARRSPDAALALSSPELSALAQDIERITELRSALAKAENRAEAKSGFLANMSHELRTPLAAILGFSESALRRDSSPEAMRHALRTTLRQGRHLLELVNDILDASKIESGQMRVQGVPVSPWPVLQACIELLRPRADEKGLTLSLRAEGPVPERVRVDELRLKQIVINLVGNALKFTASGAVTVRVSAEAASGQWSVQVDDTGIGLTDEQATRIFERFEQSDESTTRRYGGTGLGLYISRQLARQMGGDLSARGTPGVGSCFALTLPIGLKTPFSEPAETPDSTAEPEPAAPPALTGHVLVVDDVPDLRQLLVTLVRATGARTSEASNGEEALACIERDAPDLVLMDMHMPVMDGRTAVAQLVRRGFSGAIYACSADVLPDDVADFIALGCAGALSKPVDVAALHRVLERHLPAGAPAKPPEAALDAASTPAAPVDPMAAALAKVRGRFVAGAVGEREAIAAEWTTGGLEALRERAHRLKGSAGTFGFPDVSRAAAALEDALKRGETDLAPLIEALDGTLAGLD